MRIERNQVAALEYTLKNDAGEVLDTNVGKEPLWYLHGHGNLVPGLEKALEGKTSGESLEVVVEPAEGYGERREDLVFDVPKAQLGGEPVRGARVTLNGPQGQRLPARVVKVKLREVTLDANHELAGENLHFAVTIKDVRKAKKVELEHGHAHSPGHHHH